MFHPEEKKRYQRHFSLEGFGIEAQLKLKNAKVIIIGLGALGCPVATYLTAAGVGKITLVDGDTVDYSNLHRQPLYTIDNIGQKKVFAAKKRLNRINEWVDIHAIDVFIHPTVIFELIQGNDLIIDCSDNFETRYLINDAGVLKNVPMVHGSVVGFTGTVAVFHLFNEGWSANYRDLFPEPPHPEDAPSCAVAGVIGIIPSIIGSLQANECIKILTGIGTPLSNQFLTYNALSNKQQVFKYQKLTDNPLNHANENFIFETNYTAFCSSIGNNMKSITVEELKNLIDNNADIQLIDVREPHEADICTLNGVLIPMGDVPAHVDKFEKVKQVVVHCRSGKRSASVIQFLESEHGFDNLYNLEGGILAWAAEIDPEMEQY